jgi:hypothetical protein
VIKYLLIIAIFVAIFTATWCLCRAGADADKKLREIQKNNNLI